MSKSLIITEKPLVAQDYARVLRVDGKRDGYLEDDTWIITWCVGHLIQLSYPEKYDESLKTWRFEDIPFLPDEYRYEIKPEVSKQYQVVHRCLQREDVDTVFWAGDSGREGQLIEELIRRYGGVRKGIKEKRIWIDSQTDEAILTGIRDAQPMSAYQSLADAGIMRSIEDYAIGINFSRALSLRYGGFSAQAFGDPRRKVIAVGRVMSCVLAMIVEKEQEIRNFKETSFYGVEGCFRSENGTCFVKWKVNEKSEYYNSPVLYDESGFKEKDRADELTRRLEVGGPALVTEATHTDSKKYAPLLFNLAELQSECTRRFHISPSKTLEVVQSLYEKKMTTYPRTDARVLSSAVASVIDVNISGLGSIPEYKSYTERIMRYGVFKSIGNGKYTDDTKIADHYAIIPTGKIESIQSLTELEKRVFDLICRRFLAIFCEPALYDNIKVVIMIGCESFAVTRKILKLPGFYELYQHEQEENETKDEKAFTLLREGMRLSIEELTVKESKTYPPKRYTSGSIILAMENAGQLIEEEELREQIKGCGIGTSATRANIIDKLVDNVYIKQNEKTQVLTPSIAGECIYEIVKETIPEMLVAKTTAEWEKGLSDIENGLMSLSTYKSKLEHFVREKTNKIIEEDKNLELEESTRPYRHGAPRVIQRHPLRVRCPKCGGSITASQYGFGCDNNKKDKTISTCDFFLGSICGVMLSDEQARELIIKKKTGPIDGLKGKQGKFKAYIKLVKTDEGALGIEFEFPELEALDDVKCPKCGGKILDNHGKGFVCEHNSQDESEKTCNFYIWKYGGKSIPKAQIVKLLKEGKTDIMTGFKSSKNPEKTFSAALTWNKEEQKISYQMAQSEVLHGVLCPICKGKILSMAGKGYFCENTRDEEKKCDFYAGSICGKQITEQALRTILGGKKTEAIMGFKSNIGKEFAASLYWNEAEKKISFVQPDEKFIAGCKCPICGGRIKIIPGYGYGCENNKKDDATCSFFLGKIAGKTLSDIDVRTLLTRGKTEEISGFKSKAGKRFNATLKLTADKTGIEFLLPNAPSNTENDAVVATDIECPKCHGSLLKTKYNLECGCGYKIPYRVSNKDLSESEISSLLLGEEIHVKGMISKSGKLFDAYLQIDEITGQLKPWRFPEKN